MTNGNAMSIVVVTGLAFAVVSDRDVETHITPGLKKKNALPINSHCRQLPPSSALRINLRAAHAVEPERAAFVLPPPVRRLDRDLEHQPQRWRLRERVRVRDDNGVVTQLAAELVRKVVKELGECIHDYHVGVGERRL
eukprot:CAMPEP_0181211814 /NCGR_PEP_ID=MMETSP1096-20121128/24000_1 /TAXON_ID=156174 ORGANISM="Chrysochromulina ericina, Strain CCMP281" /NCGR_SAMPLE_ID=MMETSP1096 /ASSEMBLY_ACC=CAM_ASM_000453 /LENGTH=137 /DNA_ID=CAMNT_0023303267 /DNA_START=140 /DNA_END=550 /DNA_ORIENTATION=-